MNHGPILIVEDNHAIRELLCAVLSDDGHDIVAVDNGIDAINAVYAYRPAAILLDLNLPQLDGEGVLKELRRAGIAVPVILITADPRGQRLGIADGVTGYVPKPFNLADLSFALDAVLGMS